MKIANVLCLGLGTVFFAVSMPHAAEQHKIPDAPANYLAMKNPVSSDDVDSKFMKKVGRLYKSKCDKCHGAEGDGKGSAAADIVIKPTAFNGPGYLKSRKDGQLFWAVKEGIKNTEMKAFGPGTDVNLSDEEMWKLIAFMREKFTN